jgi:hypothetical protein
MLEDVVDGSTAAPSIPPTFDHSFVVAVYGEMPLQLFVIREVSNQAFESEGFGPTDIPMPIESLPAWYKAPGSPSVTDGDGNSEL